MPENKSCHNCVNEKALNPCMGCVKYEKWKPRQPETDKRVFEGYLPERWPLSDYDLAMFQKMVRGFKSEGWPKRVRITVEVLK